MSGLLQYLSKRSRASSTTSLVELFELVRGRAVVGGNGELMSAVNLGSSIQRIVLPGTGAGFSDGFSVTGTEVVVVVEEGFEIDDVADGCSCLVGCIILAAST